MFTPLLSFTLLIVWTATALAGGRPAGASASPRAIVGDIVTQVRLADYVGDRAALQSLCIGLEPFTRDSSIASRVRYWRGFALWRRALNGFSEPVPGAELARDLEAADDEFAAALAIDASFGDAGIARASCLSLLIGLDPADTTRTKRLARQAAPLIAWLDTSATANPRYYWMKGSVVWYLPAARGGGQEKALALYRTGLERARERTDRGADPLEPSWGEPELLMSLAGAYLNRTPPDLVAAAQYADSALRLVPSWRYVRSTLRPQIEHAEEASQNASPTLR